MDERYKASMVLSGVGDALGFRHGIFEFDDSGVSIHKKVKEEGGLEKIEICLPVWPVSDDTVMHIATAKALIESNKTDSKNPDFIFHQLAHFYVECDKNGFDNRAPGITTLSSLYQLKPFQDNGYHVKFNERGGGCGAAMRAMCIGLLYYKPEQLDDLVRVSIESGRITHHYPVGYLGALTSALFTSYAVQEKPLHTWGSSLMKTLEKAKAYIKSTERYVDDNLKAWFYFEEAWKIYLLFRQISDGESQPVFTKEDDIEFRDELYSSWSYDGWGGASGHDSVMIAYDALLGCDGQWHELCNRGMLHGGDNDSTGAIAGAWYGALYGFGDAPTNHYEKLEFLGSLKGFGEKLYEISHQ